MSEFEGVTHRLNVDELCSPKLRQELAFLDLKPRRQEALLHLCGTLSAQHFHYATLRVLAKEAPGNPSALIDDLTAAMQSNSQSVLAAFFRAITTPEMPESVIAGTCFLAMGLILENAIWLANRGSNTTAEANAAIAKARGQL